MKRLFSLIILLWLTQFSAMATAKEQISFGGIVLDESAKPLGNVMVKVAGDEGITNAKGEFSITTSAQDIYQISFNKTGFYQALHSFSALELSSAYLPSGQLDDVVLVAKAPKRVMLAFAGDTMMGRRYYEPYFDDPVLIAPQDILTGSKAIVEQVKPYLTQADYAALNLETQIATELPRERAKKFVTFYSRPETLEALSWAGVDYVSLGNNHTYDYLESGLESTLKHLNQSDLGFSGAGLNEQQALKPHVERINQVPYAMLGYVGWPGKSEPTQTATAAHGGAAMGSMANIVSSVSSAVAQKQVAVVQYHGSHEYSLNPTGMTEQRLKSALDAGAALAIGHHPHVTQGLELYHGKLLAYSLGNFIFDQNFAATNHSFILYVWMDGDKFHRAEIVPIYIKGYQPTPATGMHRYTVMKRLTELSKMRNTVIGRSGGHGVISVDNVKPIQGREFVIAVAPGERSASLYHLPWEQQLSKVQLQGVKYRLGTNLINGSDFESFDSFDTLERGWLYDKANTRVNNFGASGQHSLNLTLNPQQSSVFGMKTFVRVFEGAQPTTVKARFLTSNKVKLDFYWQGRKTRQKLFDALNKGQKHLIQSVQLNGNKDWQTVELDFNSPRNGYRGYRVLVEISALDGTRSNIAVDDLALIEWQTAFSSKPKPLLTQPKSRLASYIGFEQPIKTKLGLKLE